MAAPTTIITTIKQFNYRGNVAEEWSNRYMFTGPTPSGPTVWEDLYDELTALERACFTSGTQCVRAYGHTSTDPHAASVWSKTRTSPLSGLLDATGGVGLPGDTAVYVSLSTNRRNSKGKPVYLRKYFHGAVRLSSDMDAVLPAQRTALGQLGTVMENGITLDARKLCDPLGNVATGHTVGLYVTTRTLKRRGRRP